MKYDILLFDADNTLFDFDASERLAFDEFAPRFGITPTNENYELYRKFNLETWAEIEKNSAPKERLLVLRYEKLFNALGIEADAEEANLVFLRALSTKGVLYPETIGLLESLKAANCRLYMITNGVTEVQDGRIAATDTEKYFDEIFISEKVGASKPHKAFFDHVAASVPNFSRDRALVVGDSLTSDVAGANQYGLDCVWFNPNGKPLPSDLKVRYIAKTLSSVASFILNS